MLKREFFDRTTLKVARDLVGSRLVRIEDDGTRLSGIIVETEAYIGPGDLGCHARAGRTVRNASMWGPPGHAYVYFTYGMHWMLNFVTEPEGFGAAVLIRAAIPLEGVERMQARRQGHLLSVLADGPAKLCRAFAIDRRFDGHDLCADSSRLFVEADGLVPGQNVITSPRMGLKNVPDPWKSLPWRFRVEIEGQSPFLVPGKK
ncbi:MAG: DNA-3-methyladenine glycosylase [Acidobacteriota bacterium]